MTLENVENSWYLDDEGVHQLPSFSEAEEEYRQMANTADVTNALIEEMRLSMRETIPIVPTKPALDGMYLETLPPELIIGLMYQGSKMCIAGSSKTFKTFAVMELACAVATGTWWFGFKCRQAKVLYVNLELLDVFFKHRLFDISVKRSDDLKTLHENLDVLTLAGEHVTADILVDSLLEKYFGACPYGLIIIDPIYKIQQGDENAAEAINKLFDAIDRLRSKLVVSIVYVHHHPKGGTTAALAKDIADRTSGSGVFGRDADVIVDMNVLTMTDKLIDTAIDLHKGKEAKVVQTDFLKRYGPDVHSKYVWFEYPVHSVDTSGMTERALERGEFALSWLEAKLDTYFGEKDEMPRQDVMRLLDIKKKETLGKRLEGSKKFKITSSANSAYVMRVKEEDA